MKENRAILNTFSNSTHGKALLDQINEKAKLQLTEANEIEAFLASVSAEDITEEQTETFRSFLVGNPSYVVAMQKMLAACTNPSISRKYLALLQTVNFHAPINKENPTTLFMRLMLIQSCRDFVGTCFDKFDSKWIPLEEKHIQFLFNKYNFSTGVDTLFSVILDNPFLILFDIFFNLDKLSQRSIDAIATELSKPFEGAASLRFHEWNRLSKASASVRGRRFLALLFDNYASLLKTIPITAWHSPIDAYGEKTTSPNCLALKTFYYSPEGQAFFTQEKRDQYPELTVLANDKTEFEPLEESRTRLNHHSYFDFIEMYQPDKEEFGLIVSLVNDGEYHKLDEFLRQPNLISLLLFYQIDLSKNVGSFVLFHLINNKNLEDKLLAFFNERPYFLNILFCRFDTNRRITVKNNHYTIQQYLFTQKGSIALLDCFAKHLPGKLKYLPIFQDGFALPNSLLTPKTPLEFANAVVKLYPDAIKRLAKEFPMLEKELLTLFIPASLHRAKTLFPHSKAPGATPAKPKAKTKNKNTRKKK